MNSKAELLKWARTEQYKAENLEKVLKLLEVLRAFITVPFLKDRFVLKGGTALNIFHFRDLPRLSVDIDLNYIGSLDKSIMQEERVLINEAIQRILVGMNMKPYRNPTAYAGGKMIWQYDSLLGQKGNLEIDFNYLYRQPLLEVEWKAPSISFHELDKIPVLDLNELAAGKLTALFSRRTSRDFFDAHHLLTGSQTSLEMLRPIWVAYLAMSDVALDNLHPDYIGYDLQDIKNHLLPVLKQDVRLRKKSNLEAWVKTVLV